MRSNATRWSRGAEVLREAAYDAASFLLFLVGAVVLALMALWIEGTMLAAKAGEGLLAGWSAARGHGPFLRLARRIGSIRRLK